LKKPCFIPWGTRQSFKNSHNQLKAPLSIQQIGETEETMCCLFTILLFLGPRVADIIWWIVQPLRWQAAFGGSFIWPILGIIFLPFTTLMWVLVAPLGMSSMNTFDWVWIAIAVVLDIASYGGGGYGNRSRMRR
jgi:hypothetical protein